MDFIEKLYNGEYRPMDEETPDNEEFHNAMSVIQETSEALCATFTDFQKELWEKHDAAQLIVEDQLHVQAFRQGFLIGMELVEDEEIRDRLLKKE